MIFIYSRHLLYYYYMISFELNDLFFQKSRYIESSF